MVSDVHDVKCKYVVSDRELGALPISLQTPLKTQKKIEDLGPMLCIFLICSMLPCMAQISYYICGNSTCTYFAYYSSCGNRQILLALVIILWTQQAFLEEWLFLLCFAVWLLSSLSTRITERVSRERKSLGVSKTGDSFIGVCVADIVVRPE